MKSNVLTLRLAELYPSHVCRLMVQQLFRVLHFDLHEIRDLAYTYCIIDTSSWLIHVIRVFPAAAGRSPEFKLTVVSFFEVRKPLTFHNAFET